LKKGKSVAHHTLNVLVPPNILKKEEEMWSYFCRSVAFDV